MPTPDPAVRSRNRASKRRGASWEISLVSWFRDKGFDAERISRKGNRDEGDVIVNLDRMTMGVFPSDHLVIEAKNAARITLSDWMRQATDEAKRWTEARKGKTGWPVVIVKRRQHSVDKSYVVMELDTFLRLIAH